MMPASNQGVGNNIGFPDVCTTPMAPSPVPIPYPNIGSNALSVPFCPTIFTSFMPAHNQYAKPAITNGDEAGCDHPMFIQSGGNNLGSVKIFLQGGPAEHLLNPCQGNNYNCSLDAKLVPSVTNVLYTYCPAGAGWSAASQRAAALELHDRPTPGLGATLTSSGGVLHVRRGGAGAQLGLRAGDRLRDARQRGDRLELAITRRGRARVLRGAPHHRPAVSAAWLPGGVGQVTLRRLSLGAAAQVDEALRALRGARGLLLDLRGNPGGALEAARDVASRFLPAGRVVAAAALGGARRELVSRGDPCLTPLTVWIDGGTASAAEALAAALADHGRARLVGAPTLGKGHGVAAHLNGLETQLGERCELRRPSGARLGRLAPAAAAPDLGRALTLTQVDA